MTTANVRHIQIKGAHGHEGALIEIKNWGPIRNRRMSDDRYIDRLQMPQSAVADMARAVPTDLVKAIVRDNYRRSAPTPPAPKGIVDTLLERFAPKAD